MSVTTTIPSTSSVFSTLLRFDLLTQWRNRRASILVVLVPVVILVSWKGLIQQFGGDFVISNCITVGLNAIGLMGYPNTVARDRDKGIFQRLRVAPAPNWAIMASRLMVQLVMIAILTAMIFLVGYQYDGISFTATGYLSAFLVSILGGAVYLSLGQVIVGLVKSPEAVNATSRLVYFVFIMVGMFGGFGMLGKQVDEAIKWSPYGAVKDVVSASLHPATWNTHTSTDVLVLIGYTIVFTALGIRYFRWSNR